MDRECWSRWASGTIPGPQLFLSLLALAVVLAAHPLSRRFAGPPVLRPSGGALTAAAAGAGSGPLTASRVLVVANETVGADELLGELRQLQNEASAEYYVCVPAHPLHTGQGAAWSPDASVIAAQHRLDQVLSILKDEGLLAGVSWAITGRCMRWMTR